MTPTAMLEAERGLTLPEADREMAPIWVEVTRGPLVESRHEVHGVLWQGAEGGHMGRTWGDPSFTSYLRSSLKPFQVLPLLVDGVAQAKGLTDEEVAVAIGSHSAQEAHLAAVRSLMAKTGVDPSMLKCGRHAPFHKETRKAVGDSYGNLHNNCSGKHAAMCAWSIAHGHDPADYRDPDHPVQRRIISLTSLLTGLPEETLAIGIDGCGVPTVGLPLWAMARMFWLLADPSRVRETDAVDVLSSDEQAALVSALGRARDVMMTQPFLIAGDERPDTDVIRITRGRLITKAGAEGVWCGADMASGTGFAFKVADGNFRAAVPAALEALLAEGLLSVEEAMQLETHRVPVLDNHPKMEVGRIYAVMPGT